MMAGVEEGTAKGSSFVSFGGVWLDELRWPHKPTLKDVVGGSGVFCELHTHGRMLMRRESG